MIDDPYQLSRPDAMKTHSPRKGLLIPIHIPRDLQNPKNTEIIV